MANLFSAVKVRYAPGRAENESVKSNDVVHLQEKLIA